MDHDHLTPREREIAVLAAGGLTNQAIAAELSVSAGTVKVHLHNIYRKLGVGSRSALPAAIGPNKKAAGAGPTAVTVG